MLRCSWIPGYSGVKYLRLLMKVCEVTVVILLSIYIKTVNMLYNKMKREPQFSSLYYKSTHSVIFGFVKTLEYLELKLWE
jgi:hypothetical protein